jgi:hypothetical protein
MSGVLRKVLPLGIQLNNHTMNVSPIIITPAYLNEVSESFRQRIQAILPQGLTCTKFTDGRGQFGWSYYARIEGDNEILKMIRISNHDSGACGSSDYICGGWDTLDSLFDRVNHYFNGKPAVKQLVEMTGEYPTADAILKVFPTATNIVQGDFVRTAKKSGNAVYSFTFSVLK